MHESLNVELFLLILTLANFYLSLQFDKAE
jgi:hypothetical protein